MRLGLGGRAKQVVGADDDCTPLSRPLAGALAGPGAVSGAGQKRPSTPQSLTLKASRQAGDLGDTPASQGRPAGEPSAWILISWDKSWEPPMAGLTVAVHPSLTGLRVLPVGLGDPGVSHIRLGTPQESPFQAEGILRAGSGCPLSGGDGWMGRGDSRQDEAPSSTRPAIAAPSPFGEVC